MIQQSARPLPPVTARSVCCVAGGGAVQIVAMFVSFNFAWPVELQQLYAAMSVFNFNIQITAPEVRYRALAGHQGPPLAAVCANQRL